MVGSLVFVRQGEAYSPKYVDVLTAQIRAFHDVPIYTLTDQPDTPGSVRALQYDWTGWWAKMELFSPENADLRPCLYLDLDTYVLSPIDDLLSDSGERFEMLTDFLQPKRPQSAVMIIPEDTGKIWDKWVRDPRGHMSRNRSDQEFLAPFVEGRLQDRFEGLVSYRKHSLDKPAGRVINFHGRPKPHQAEGWAGDIWHGFDGSA